MCYLCAYFFLVSLGRPVHESPVDGEHSKIELNWTLSDLNTFFCRCYPLISLNLIGLELARVGKGRKLKKLQTGSVRELRKAVYIASCASNGGMDSFNFKALSLCCLTDIYRCFCKAFICIHRAHQPLECPKSYCPLLLPVKLYRCLMKM